MTLCLTQIGLVAAMALGTITSAAATKLPNSVIEVRIDEQGTVSDCKVVKPNGDPEIYAKSCEIAKAKMHFTPAKLDGRPVASTKKIPLHWTVDSSAAQ